MAQPITISTKQFIKTKEAEIDGVTYTVRRMGAGTSLDMSKRMKEMQALRSEWLNLQGKSKADGKDYTEEFVRITAKLSDAIAGIEEIYTSLFDDGGDGSKARQMVHEVGFENVPAILTQIFGESDA